MSVAPAPIRPIMRSIVATTESALNGVPSWNVTSSRSVNSHVVSSTIVGSAVASDGISSPSGVRASSVS